jgi:hypothetical protein
VPEPTTAFAPFSGVEMMSCVRVRVRESIMVTIVTLSR